MATSLLLHRCSESTLRGVQRTFLSGTVRPASVRGFPRSRGCTPAVRETAVRDAQGALEPFEAPLKIIEVIAALAPLLGLLGTVMGMMEAFSAMAATEGRANAAQLSGGIYEALATTAAGLVVAIPAIFFLRFFGVYPSKILQWSFTIRDLL